MKSVVAAEDQRACPVRSDHDTRSGPQAQDGGRDTHRAARPRRAGGARGAEAERRERTGIRGPHP